MKKKLNVDANFDNTINTCQYLIVHISYNSLQLKCLIMRFLDKDNLLNKTQESCLEKSWMTFPLKVACVVNVKLAFTDWLFYNLIILIK